MVLISGSGTLLIEYIKLKKENEELRKIINEAKAGKKHESKNDLSTGQYEDTLSQSSVG